MLLACQLIELMLQLKLPRHKCPPSRAVRLSGAEMQSLQGQTDTGTLWQSKAPPPCNPGQPVPAHCGGPARAGSASASQPTAAHVSAGA